MRKPSQLMGQEEGPTRRGPAHVHSAWAAGFIGVLCAWTSASTPDRRFLTGPVGKQDCWEAPPFAFCSRLGALNPRPTGGLVESEWPQVHQQIGLRGEHLVRNHPGSVGVCPSWRPSAVVGTSISDGLPAGLRGRLFSPLLVALSLSGARQRLWPRRPCAFSRSTLFLSAPV